MCPLDSDILLQERKLHDKDVSFTSSAIPSISTKLNKTQAKQQHKLLLQPGAITSSAALDLSK